LDGTPVVMGQTIPADAIVAGRLQFVPVATLDGSALALFTFQVQDDGGTAAGGADLDTTPNTLTISIGGPHPWHNALNAFDVDGDGAMAPGDALSIINCINAFGSGSLPRTGDDGKFYDVSGDDMVSPVDALLIINQINAFGSAEGEAVATGTVPPPPITGADVLELLALDVASAANRKRRA